MWSWYGPWLRAQPFCLLVIGGLVPLLWWCCHCGNAPRFNWLWWFDRSVNHPDWPINCQNVAKSNCRGWLTAPLSLRSTTQSVCFSGSDSCFIRVNIVDVQSFLKHVFLKSESCFYLCFYSLVAQTSVPLYGFLWMGKCVYVWLIFQNKAKTVFRTVFRWVCPNG